jgi:oxaloacetate decarboxylase alpha subunit
MGAVSFVDTTLRDGQMSLWATNMTTAMMLPIAESIDRAGFQAAELLAAAFFKKLVRELRDDPWERIRLIHARMPNTPLRAIRGRYMSAFQITPASIMQLWLERLAANGIREIRISDSSNTAAVWREQIRSAQAVGMTAIVNLIFSISPKHTDEYYAERAGALERFGAGRICIKDPGGLLTPERTRTLVPAVLREAGSVPVELHTHCNVGMGTPSCVEAIKLGIRLVDTAVPPLSDASSNPSVFDVLANARALGYSTSLDERPLAQVEQHLTALARRERLPLGTPARYDSFHYLHQVPGGMISNLRHQLSGLRMEGKLRDVLEEAAVVRAELGYPIMVTPYSQFVGAQAMMDVAQGERYRVVSDELIQYALGFWGEEERASIQPDVRERILDSPRARQLAASRPVELTLEELREQYGGPGVSDEELLLRYFSSESDVAAMRAAPAPLTYNGGGPAVLRLIEQLTAHGGFSYLELQKGAESFTLRRNG